MSYFGKYFMLLFLFKYSNALQCLDHDKNPVDWYVIYKLPLQANSSNQLIQEGAAYTYITANDVGDWKLSAISINDSNSIIGLTMQSLYTAKASSSIHILYNDELPDGPVNFKKGHTKGFILGDSTGGIWMIHSVPRFPDMSHGMYYFPHNGYEYGQSFLCISLDMKNLNEIGTQLLYNEPSIYFQNIPDNLKMELPKLDDVINNVDIETAPWYHTGYLVSKGGVNFVSFAKGRKFAKELYDDWVAPSLNVSLLVETWPNEPGRLPSDCGKPFKVKNIKTISMDIANEQFKATTDHSKWAVADANSLTGWICIGDINRAKPQSHRGGGTVCFNNIKVAAAYQKIIQEVENC